MAEEVQAQAYLINVNIPDVPFRYNFLHDLESLWWIAVWFLFALRLANETREERNEVSRNFASRRQEAKILFPRSLDSFPRWRAFRAGFASMVKFLPKVSIPSGEILNKLRLDLVADYTAVEVMKEGQFAIDLDGAKNAHTSCSKYFGSIRREMDEQKTDVVALETEELARKRKAEASLRDVEDSKRQAI